MTTKTFTSRLLLVATALTIAGAWPALAADPPAAKPAATPEVRDGSKDFDFLIGKRKIHLKRLLNPLTGSDQWVEFDGITEARKLGQGPANLDELVVTDPVSKQVIRSFTLRLYDAATGLWSLYYGRVTDGSLGVPTVGKFRDGVGEFYNQEVWRGRLIWVRYKWMNTQTPKARFEQAFSEDGGKTWETNWITEQEALP
jgi:hypothetical protein